MAPPLSVVIPTTHRWPEVALPLGSVWPEVNALGAEIVIADGTGAALPPDHPLDRITWLRAPGATVFELRAMGIAAARGDVVAVTEDHVTVPSDYCRQVLAAHAEHADALLIGGAVVNGSTDPIGWASYFMSNIQALPPELGPWNAPLTGQANITYKRRLFDQHPATTLQRADLRAELQAKGLALNDPRIQVLHIQSLGLRGSCMHHFHDGRHVASVRRAELHGARWALELAKDLSLGWRIPVAAARVLVRTALRYPSLRPDLAASAPMIALLTGFHCAGELAGFVAGPGDSPRHIP